MLAEVRTWLDQRTSRAEDWDIGTLLRAKRGQRVSVVLPARNESATVGAIVAAIRTALREAVPLVDEIIVIDSRSTDDTARVAAEAGAAVFHQDQVRADLPLGSGKGEALWKSLFVATGDIIVFVDADLIGFSPSYVTGLLGPLLTDPAVAYVKACYDRPLTGSEGPALDGGRVTELVARPLLNQYWPRLAGFVQPLSGEYAGRGDVLRQVPFMSHYGVELALLIDLLEQVGLDALAQVDLGLREHTHQSTADLGVMAAQIQHTARIRLARSGRLAGDGAASTELVQYTRGATGRYRPLPRDTAISERPPAASLQPQLV
ncbi:glucosyl-3-phosphoglycerate synthase [Marinitenerispora sediminis]|uniref:Glucosyl-3-phosphoglycerate synthase n=1 Tax=Marinitenerispora sediminis TaxID=1931232 RepID=A0A368SYM8_9ACTN|nr:glucosyl-3-phosphoglycerate synthase [Marinitenerispora sediminis]RCV47692.1 glucosyl-3-phosphoglycerate synthase [Marinitenerispora sediminis]RCV47999.1 glucosyl-3-phosphoglycerate synthase [Marinitenerispora sediminis]RCV49643.1 glucosyl-3-phosphoglycerate synthase [Marinitenerispora sediminis]